MGFLVLAADSSKSCQLIYGPLVCWRWPQIDPLCWFMYDWQYLVVAMHTSVICLVKANQAQPTPNDLCFITRVSVAGSKATVQSPDAVHPAPRYRA